MSVVQADPAQIVRGRRVEIATKKILQGPRRQAHCAGYVLYTDVVVCLFVDE